MIPPRCPVAPDLADCSWQPHRCGAGRSPLTFACARRQERSRHGEAKPLPSTPRGHSCTPRRGSAPSNPSLSYPSVNFVSSSGTFLSSRKRDQPPPHLSPTHSSAFWVVSNGLKRACTASGSPSSWKACTCLRVHFPIPSPHFSSQIAPRKRDGL